MTIQFNFHPEKAVEAAALFLKLHGKPMKYLGLLKLLYMADRIALERLEQPISGDHYVSMDRGPVLSAVYDLIKGNKVDGALDVWSKYISSHSNYEVSLLKDPGVDELCEDEIDIIKQVYQEKGHFDRFDLVEITHLFPEWQNPNGSPIPIFVEDILQNIGKTNDEIEEIRKEAEREAYLDLVLND
ncbi:Panacea domain-containing protein [Scytonema sp. NUACC26]|uniref:Panacea domain-containing protein n=1 Tax=Scytonema sp. NUACC26 TaxID=3140176 RepID=UPI0034DBE608